MIESNKQRAFLGAKGVLKGENPNTQPGTSALQQALQKRRMNAGDKLKQKAVGETNPGLNYSPTTPLPPN